jgi:DNA-binding transcriptional LysR family regulator
MISMTDDQTFELRHLRTFLAVLEEGTFGRAARRLAYTQSAVSQQIAALERTAGVRLFDRPGGPRPVVPTRAGELLAEHARAVLAAAEAARADLARFRDGDAGRLVVGTFQSVAVRVLPQVVGRLRAEAPGLRITLQEHEDSDVLLAELAAGRLDGCFIVGDPPAEPALEVTELGSDPFLLMSPSAERLADEGAPVPLTMLRHLPLVGQPLNRCQLLLERGLQANGVEPDVVFRTNDNGAVQAMVRSGGCHAVMPRLTIDPDDPLVSVHPLEPALPVRRIRFVSRAGPGRPPAAARVAAAAAAVGRQLLDDPAR